MDLLKLSQTDAHSASIRALIQLQLSRVSILEASISKHGPKIDQIYNQMIKKGDDVLLLPLSQDPLDERLCKRC